MQATVGLPLTPTESRGQVEMKERFSLELWVTVGACVAAYQNGWRGETILPLAENSSAGRQESAERDSAWQVCLGADWAFSGLPARYP